MGGDRRKIISETSKSLQLFKRVNLANKKTYSLEQSHRDVSATLKAHIFLLNPSSSFRLIIIN